MRPSVPHAAFAAIASATILLALGCATGKSSGPRCPADGGSPWIAVTSTHFVLSTDRDEQEARQISNDLESMFAAIADVGLASTDVPKLRIDVVYFRRRDDYLQFAPELSSALFHWARPNDFERAPLVLVEGDLVHRTRERLQHELTHWFVHHHLPQAPIWLHEGLADYLSTLDV